MAEVHFDWKRFWVPRGEEYSAPDGYLMDPESEYSQYYQPNVVSFENINRKSCLVLLGETGIGKSKTIEHEYNITNKSLAYSDFEDFSLFINLNAMNETSLHNDLKNNRIDAWKNGTNNFFLFLDSFDECMCRISNLANYIFRTVSDWPHDRLFLRIACRTAVWPVSLERNLEKLWGADEFGVFELLPLRKHDVRIAAESYETNADSFIDEIGNKNAVPFAIKPVTLMLLLRLFKKDGKLPSLRKELYKHGCRALIEESNRERHDSHDEKLKGRASPFERLQIASRIAFLTIFSNKQAIWNGIESDAPSECLTFSAISGSDESIVINRSMFDETLYCGLFSALGQYKLCWSHRSYQEYLAAFYVVNNGLSLKQIVSLIFHNEFSPPMLVPQLKDVAAWLADMRKDVFDYLINIEPDVLLSCNLAGREETDLSVLLGNIFSSIQNTSVIEGNLLVNKELFFQNIGSVLIDYISGKHCRRNTRIYALRIARSLKLVETQNILLSTVSDIHEDYRVRSFSSYVLVNVCDDDTKTQIYSQLENCFCNDFDDDIKGYLLKALWPDNIPAEELFKTITVPKNKRYIGPYSFLLENYLSSKLKKDDLLVALEWVNNASQEECFSPLIYGIIEKAINNIDEEGVLSTLCNVILERIERNDMLAFPKTFEGDARKKLFAGLMKHLDPLKISPYDLASPFSLLIDKNDIEIFVDLLREESDREKELFLCKLIRYFQTISIYSYNEIYKIINNKKYLIQEFSWIYEPIPLGSEQSDNYIKAHSRQLSPTNNRQNSYSDNDTNKDIVGQIERITILLSRIESGEHDFWVNTTRELSISGSNTHYNRDLDLEINSKEFWLRSDETMKGRILNAAIQYIEHGDPKESIWFGYNKINLRALAGLKAFVLLFGEKPEYLKTLSKEFWEKWASVIVSFNTESTGNEQEIQKQLIKSLYTTSPQRIISIIDIVVNTDNRIHQNIYGLDKFEHCWDQMLIGFFVNKAKQEEMSSGTVYEIVKELTVIAIKDSVSIVEDMVRKAIGADTAYEKAVSAAIALFEIDESVAWEVLHIALFESSIFRRMLVGRMANSYNFRDNFGTLLTEDQLKELFLLINKEFPYDEKLVEESIEDDIGTAKKRIGEFKYLLLKRLEEKGTKEAVEKLNEIAKKSPEPEWIKEIALSALNKTLQTTWTPLDPKHLLKLATNKSFRVVSTERDLIDLIIESLEKIQKTDFGGETPLSFCLWDEIEKYKFKPKNENCLSDYIKVRLKNDISDRGIVINREVEIKRKHSDLSGEKTDIHVDAVSRSEGNDKSDIISLIIEVKGCWHPDLLTAMKTQLKDRYLSHEGCNNGLYVVGWYTCSKWDDDDNGKKQAAKLDRNETNKKLQRQAESLSNEITQIRSFILDIALN